MTNTRHIHGFCIVCIALRYPNVMGPRQNICNPRYAHYNNQLHTNSPKCSSTNPTLQQKIIIRGNKTESLLYYKPFMSCRCRVNYIDQRTVFVFISIYFSTVPLFLVLHTVQLMIWYRLVSIVHTSVAVSSMQIIWYLRAIKIQLDQRNIRKSPCHLNNTKIQCKRNPQIAIIL